MASGFFCSTLCLCDSFILLSVFVDCSLLLPFCIAMEGYMTTYLLILLLVDIYLLLKMFCTYCMSFGERRVHCIQLDMYLAVEFRVIGNIYDIGVLTPTHKVLVASTSSTIPMYFLFLVFCECSSSFSFLSFS